MENKQVKTEYSIKQIAIIGVSTGIGIFLIGFGVMSLFWLQARNVYTGDKGFFYWRAATWGDGLCLPILVGALCAYKASLHQLNSRKKFISRIFGSIAGIIGIFIQASWIISDKTEPNWTIEKHHFYPSGWYHAIYFTFMFFIITTLMVQVFFARRQTSKFQEYYPIDALHTILLSLIWFSGLGYLFMHNIDDFYNSNDYMIKTIITLCLFIICSFVYCFLSNQKTTKTVMLDIQSILAGSIAAMGFGLSVYYGKFDWQSALLCTFFSLVFIRLDINKIEKTIKNIFIVVLPVFFLTLAILGTDNIFYAIVLSLITVILPVVLVPEDNKYKVMGGLLITLALFSNISSTFLVHTTDYSELINTSISIVIFIVCSLYIPRIFKDSVISEEDRIINNNSSKKVVNAIYSSYVIMFFVTFSAVIMLMKSIYIAFSEFIKPGVSLNYEYILSWKNNILIILFVIIILILFIIGLLCKKSTKLIRWCAVLLLFLSYICIIINLLLAKVPSFDNYNLLLCFLNIWIIFWVSLFVAIGFYDNIIKIRGIDVQLDKPVLWGAIFVFAGCFVSCLLASYSINSYNVSIGASVPRLMIGLIVVVCCIIVLPTLCCKIISYPKITAKDITDNDATSGVMHIGFLMTFPVLIAVLSVSFISSLVVESIVEAKNDMNICLVVNFVICCFTLVSGLAVAIVYCLKNNVEHLNKRIKKYEQDKNKSKSLYELSCHLRRQNIMVILMLAPYLLIPFFLKLIFSYIQTDSNMKTLVKDLYSSYIPSKYNDTL